MNKELASFIPSSDSLSQLLQLQARRAGLTKITWTGKGRADIDALCLFASNADLLSKALWDGLKELLEMKSVHDLPEDIQAKICAIVLTARTRFELSLDTRNARANNAHPFVPPPGGLG